jgi:rhomboid family protein
MSYSFGPGPMTPAVKALIIANVAVYALTLVAYKPIYAWFGLTPAAVFTQGRIWQMATYLFVHSTDPLHVLFNMLFLWLFGIDLEKRWGTQNFVKYYALTGIGAGVCVAVMSALPFEFTRSSYNVPTVGASGAIFGIMLAWALLFPHRQIFFMMMFPLPARVFVLIMGGLQFVYLLRGNTGVSSLAHLGGLVVGWFYLKGPRNLRLDLQYRLTKWRMERMRRRFNIHRGGRDDWENRIH